MQQGVMANKPSQISTDGEAAGQLDLGGGAFSLQDPSLRPVTRRQAVPWCVPGSFWRGEKLCMMFLCQGDTCGAAEECSSSCKRKMGLDAARAAERGALLFIGETDVCRTR